MSENLWPDFDTGPKLRSPKTVIEEAGVGLEKKTNGLIRFYRMRMAIKDNNVEATYSLYTAVLGYHFPFLQAKFAVDPVYPVTIVAHKMSNIVANDENELTASLANIFSAPTTVSAIQRLMSLAQQ